jgi:hypothetical protein
MQVFMLPYLQGTFYMETLTSFVSPLNDEWCARFARIAECKSLTVVEYCLDDMLKISGPDTPTEQLQKLQEALQTNKLDLVLAQAYEAIGDLPEAKRLRDYVARRKLHIGDPELNTILGLGDG